MVSTMTFFNKIYTKAVMLMAAMAFTANADAQEFLSAEKLTIKPGETKEVALNYSCPSTRSGCEVHITLPEGLSFVMQEYENADEEIEKSYAKKGKACYSSHGIAESLKEQTLSVVIFELSKKNLRNDNVLLTVLVKAAEDIANNSEISVKYLFEDPSDVYQTFTVAVQKDAATGISSVETANSEVEVYDAAGVRKASAGKGLNIIRTAGKTIKVVK